MAVSTWQPILAPVPDAAPTPAGLIALHPGYTPFAGATLAEDPAATPSNAALTASLRGLPAVDAVGVERRAAALASRSIKTTAKAQGISLAVSMIDLTTLEGSDTPGKVRSLCRKAVLPDPADPQLGPVAAVCVYPDLVATAVTALAGSPVHVASVATAFPAGRASLRVRCADTADALAAGATEIDMVIDRGAFLAGDYATVAAHIAEVKRLCGGVHLKVILETGELATYDNVRRAAWLSMLAGADVIKTSTGKVAPAATLPVTLVMLEAVRDYHALTGRRVGVKAAGGIRTTKDALRYLVLVNEIAGPDWLTPAGFRFGASALLNDLLMQRRRLTLGSYVSPRDVSVD